MRSVLVAAVSGLVLAASAASAQTPAQPAAHAGVGPRPSYNMQSGGEDIGPLAGGAKVHRVAAEKATPHGKARRHR